MTARFEYPVIQDNPTGWGPNSIPEKFKDMPYQPFSKADRLGKVSLPSTSSILIRNLIYYFILSIQVFV